MKIEAGKVHTLKLNNADEIVTKVVEDHDDYLLVTQPLSAVPTEKGVQLIFTVFTADPKENIRINKSAITMVCTTAEQVSDHYTEATTGIKAVRNSKILMG
jgi:hypothetical protein